MRRIECLLALLVGMAWAEAVAAQAKNENARPSKGAESISTGQSLKAALEILKRRGIEVDRTGYAILEEDPDETHLSFSLDEEHTDVCLFYSKSRQSVTGLDMVFFPSISESYKTNRTWLSATRIDLFPDSTYAVFFAKPRAPRPAQPTDAKSPKSEAVSAPGNVKGENN